MKFWKRLSNLIDETLPDWRDKFLSYKDLKKQLKLIYPKEGDGDRPSKRRRLGGETDGRDDWAEVTGAEVVEVTDFVKLLEEQIEKLNSFFVDKEEEYVIRLKVLQDRLAETTDSNEELTEVGREIVDFHGEMVLLENYSALNYTGLVEILKKYDKLSGAPIRLHFIQKVLEQPFFKTDVLNKLVKDCEAMLDRNFSMNKPSSSSSDATSSARQGFESNVLNKLVKDCAAMLNRNFSMNKRSSSSSEATSSARQGFESNNGANEEREQGEGCMNVVVPNEIAEIENMESMYVKLTTSALTACLVEWNRGRNGIAFRPRFLFHCLVLQWNHFCNSIGMKLDGMRFHLRWGGMGFQPNEINILNYMIALVIKLLKIENKNRN